MRPVMCHIIAFLWDRQHINFINEQIDIKVPAFVYLAKASLQICDLSHHISVNSPDDDLVKVETCSDAFAK
jgi:hypothetical protein